MSDSRTPRPDTQTDDRRDRTLPVTEEVGSEGGSYADPTSQVATFGGHDAPRTIDSGSVPSTPGDALERSSIDEHGVGTMPGPATGMLRYPTEPPSPPSAREDPRTGTRWKSAAMAAAAGTAAAFLWRRRR